MTPEPPHASTWQSVRTECSRRERKDCRYPFCNCIVVKADQQEARQEQQGEAA